MSNSRPEYSVAEDEDQSATNSNAANPEIFTMSDSDSDEMQSDREPKSETDSEADTEEQIPQSSLDLSSATTSREELVAQTQPQTDGNLHIHSVL